jgi:hypothetical protein
LETIAVDDNDRSFEVGSHLYRPPAAVRSKSTLSLADTADRRYSSGWKDALPWRWWLG